MAMHRCNTVLLISSSTEKNTYKKRFAREMEQTEAYSPPVQSSNLTQHREPVGYIIPYHLLVTLARNAGLKH
jgi:hypothetical protein